MRPKGGSAPPDKRKKKRGVGPDDRAHSRFAPAPRTIDELLAPAHPVRTAPTRYRPLDDKQKKILAAQVASEIRRLTKPSGREIAEQQFRAVLRAGNQSLFTTQRAERAGRWLGGGVLDQPNYIAGLGRRIAEDYQHPLRSILKDIPTANEVLVGGDLTKALSGEDYDPRWAAAEAALLPFGIGRPLKAATKALRGGKRAGGNELSPVPKGHVRLYRGEGKTEAILDPHDPHTMDKGGWFTDKLPIAQEYARRNKGRVYYKDILEEDARPWGRRRESDSGEIWTEYRFPQPDIRPGLRDKTLLPPTEAGKKVRESLGSARITRAEQQKLYKKERAERAGAAEEARVAAGGGIEGHRAAKAALKGELPKVKFDKLRQGVLSEGELDEMLRIVDRHPDLRFYDKLHTREALTKSFYEGVTPQASQIKFLQTVFGQDAIKASASRSKWKVAGSVVNIPRSLMSTLDISGTARQGLVAAVAHPNIVRRNMKPQIKALVSENNHAAIMDEILTRPNADRYERARLPLTTLDDITTREEQFSSGLAETLTGGKRLSPVRASARAYTGFLNKTRADVFDLLDDLARAEGHNVESLKFERDLARLVGSMTGRGPLPQSLEGAATFLNATFFSPRLAASRIDLLFAPATYAKTHPFVRKQALKSMLRLYAAGSAILALAAAAGGKVSLDPRNADFAKIRVGNSRVDVFGGFQQYVRLIAQVTTNTIVSSTTGEKMTLGAGFGDMSRKDIVERFGVSKFSPPVSFVYDFFKGTDFAGEPFEVKKAMLQRLVPFIAQDLNDMYRETGSVPATVGAAGLIGVGVGVQTYAPKDVAAKKLVEWEEKTRGTLKLSPGEPIPEVFARAKRNSVLRSELSERYKEQHGLKKLDERGRLMVLVETMLQSDNTEMDGVAWRRYAESASPLSAKKMIPKLEKRLGFQALDKLSERAGKEGLSQRQREFASKP